jgi:hypothetical protein
MRQFPVGVVTNIGVKTAQRMPTARYYKDQARALLTWAHAVGNKAHADQLRIQAAKELERAEQAHAAVPDLNTILTEFNNQQLLTGSGPTRLQAPPKTS